MRWETVADQTFPDLKGMKLVAGTPALHDTAAKTMTKQNCAFCDCTLTEPPSSEAPLTAGAFGHQGPKLTFER